MPYNRVNKLETYKLIVELTNKHYIPEITSYRGIWRKYVMPVYPISYQRYMHIINTPNLETLLREERKRHGQWEDPDQPKLFQ